MVYKKWYQHLLEAKKENDFCKILWCFNVQANLTIKAQRLDMIVIEKDQKQRIIINSTVPYGSRIKLKENEKTEKYQDLARELKKLQNIQVKIIPVVIGALGISIPCLLRGKIRSCDQHS